MYQLSRGMFNVKCYGLGWRWNCGFGKMMNESVRKKWKKGKWKKEILQQRRRLNNLKHIFFGLQDLNIRPPRCVCVLWKNSGSQRWGRGIVRIAQYIPLLISVYNMIKVLPYIKSDYALQVPWLPCATRCSSGGILPFPRPWRCSGGLTGWSNPGADTDPPPPPPGRSSPSTWPRANRRCRREYFKGAWALINFVLLSIWNYLKRVSNANSFWGKGGNTSPYPPLLSHVFMQIFSFSSNLFPLMFLSFFWKILGRG